MRRHAAVIASAHGQVAWIFRRRRRPPRASERVTRIEAARVLVTATTP